MDFWEDRHLLFKPKRPIGSPLSAMLQIQSICGQGYKQITISDEMLRGQEPSLSMKGQGWCPFRSQAKWTASGSHELQRSQTVDRHACHVNRSGCFAHDRCSPRFYIHYHFA